MEAAGGCRLVNPRRWDLRFRGLVRRDFPSEEISNSYQVLQGGTRDPQWGEKSAKSGRLEDVGMGGSDRA